MNDNDALLAAIAADPLDVLARMALTDWAEERGANPTVLQLVRDGSWLACDAVRWPWLPCLEWGRGWYRPPHTRDISDRILYLRGGDLAFVRCESLAQWMDIGPRLICPSLAGVRPVLERPDTRHYRLPDVGICWWRKGAAPDELHNGEVHRAIFRHLPRREGDPPERRHFARNEDPYAALSQAALKWARAAAKRKAGTG